MSSPFKESKLIKELRLLSLNGQNKTAFQKNALGGWKYDITTNGLKVNMPDINAAIGLAQIKKYKNVLLPEREQIFLKYNTILSQYSWAILPTFRAARWRHSSVRPAVSRLARRAVRFSRS